MCLPDRSHRVVPAARTGRQSRDVDREHLAEGRFFVNGHRSAGLQTRRQPDRPRGAAVVGGGPGAVGSRRLQLRIAHDAAAERRQGSVEVVVHDRQSVPGGKSLDVRRRWPQPDEDRRDGCGYRQRRPDGKQVMTETPQHGRPKPGTRERARRCPHQLVLEPVVAVAHEPPSSVSRIRARPRLTRLRTTISEHCSDAAISL